MTLPRTDTQRWEDSQSEPRCPECRHEARECVCDPPEAYGKEPVRYRNLREGINRKLAEMDVGQRRRGGKG